MWIGRAKNISQEHYKSPTVYYKISKTFLRHYALNFSTYPVTTGAIFQNSPPRKKSSTIARSLPLPPRQSQWHSVRIRLEEKAGGERGGGERGQRGEKRGGSGDDQGADTKTTGVGKLQSRARTEKLSQYTWIKMYQLYREIRRDLDNLLFFSHGTSTVLDSHALLSNKADYTSLYQRGGNSLNIKQALCELWQGKYIFLYKLLIWPL